MQLIKKIVLVGLLHFGQAALIIISGYSFCSAECKIITNFQSARFLAPHMMQIIHHSRCHMASLAYSYIAKKFLVDQVIHLSCIFLAIVHPKKIMSLGSWLVRRISAILCTELN